MSTWLDLIYYDYKKFELSNALETGSKYTLSVNINDSISVQIGDVYVGVVSNRKLTFKATEDMTSTELRLYLDHSVYIDEFKIKLEKGNKATDWTPAPEDVDSQIDANETRISTAESTISQHATDISLRVLTSTYTSGLATKENTVYKQSTAPAHSNGRLWLDTSVTPNQLKRSTGSAWVKATPSTASEVGAYSQADGSALASRVNAAELKITDSAIVSTVRKSSLYLSDLDGKVSSNEIISEINQSAEAIKIQASNINLVGAVTVLSDITGNLGTVTAGTINGITLNIGGSTDGSANIKNSAGATIATLDKDGVVIKDGGLVISQDVAYGWYNKNQYTKFSSMSIDGLDNANAQQLYRAYNLNPQGLNMQCQRQDSSDFAFRIVDAKSFSNFGNIDDTIMQSNGNILVGAYGIASPKITVKPSSGDIITQGNINFLQKYKPTPSGLNLNTWNYGGFTYAQDALNRPTSGNGLCFNTRISDSVYCQSYIVYGTSKIWVRWIDPTTGTEISPWA